MKKYFVVGVCAIALFSLAMFVFFGMKKNFSKNPAQFQIPATSYLKTDTNVAQVATATAYMMRAQSSITQIGSQSAQQSKQTGVLYTKAKFVSTSDQKTGAVTLVSSEGRFTAVPDDTTYWGCRYTKYWDTKIPQEAMMPRDDEFSLAARAVVEKNLGLGKPVLITTKSQDTTSGTYTIDRIMVLYCE